MNEWIPAILTIVINLVAIAFAFGKLSQSMTDVKRRLGVSDDAVIAKNNKDSAWKEKMEGSRMIHDMLPKCVDAFNDITRELGVLSGKIDTLIGVARKP